MIQKKGPAVYHCSTPSEKKDKFNGSQSVLGVKIGERTTKSRLVLLGFSFSFSPRRLMRHPSHFPLLIYPLHLTISRRLSPSLTVGFLISFAKGNTDRTSAGECVTHARDKIRSLSPPAHVKNPAELECLFASHLTVVKGFNYFGAGYRQYTARCDKCNCNFFANGLLRATFRFRCIRAN